MATRDYSKYIVSASEPGGVTLGDQWFNSTSSRLFQRTALSTGQVVWTEILISISTATNFTTAVTGGTIATTLTAKALSGTAIALPGNQSYTLTGTRQFLDVYVDGYKLVRGLDYNETSSTAITPLISLPIGSIIEYRIS